VEKPFVIRWNIIGFAGGGAFLSVLLKAFLFGVIFALLGGGIAFLIERFIPEITGGEAAGADAGPAGKVNIVLDEGGKDKEGDIEELRLDETEGEAGAGGGAVDSPSLKRERAFSSGAEAEAVEEAAEEQASSEIEAEFAEDLAPMEETDAAARAPFPR
jgi:hypothetical protein